MFPTFRILVFCLAIVFSADAVVWSRGKEIVWEDYWYYVLHPNGEKVAVVSARTGGEPRVEVVFSPDSNYVVYTEGNGTGWEGQGRNLCYRKTDGSQRTVMVRTEDGIRDLNWVKARDKQYIVFTQWGSGEAMGHVKVYDFDKHNMVFDTLGMYLVRIGDTARFLVNSYLVSEKMAYILDVSEPQFKISSLDSLAKPESDSSRFRCAEATLRQTAPDLRAAGVGFIPAYWPHDFHDKSEYIDLVRNSSEFKRLSCLVPSPDGRFIAFSATGSRFTCNGILDTKTHKTHALRFFLGTFDGQPCWSPNSEYVAFINLVGGHGKYINVFSIDSVLSTKSPMIAQEEFERPTDKYFVICFSLDSNSLSFDVTGSGRPNLGEITIRR
jgi:hypothetical protein